MARSRARIQTYAPSVTGGGGGTSTPTVQVGPEFGPGAANDASTSVAARAALTMPALALAGTLNERTALTMPALTAAFTGHTARAKLTATALGAPFWQSEAHGSVANANNFNINIPAGTAVGNLLLLFVGTTSLTPSITTPSGWTLIRTDNGGTSPLLNVVASFWRIADGTEGGSLNVATAQDASVGEIHRIIGHDPTTPINASAGGSVLTAGLTPDPVDVSVTTTVVNCLVFCYLLHAHLNLPQTHTAPASHTERTDFEVSNSGVLYSSTTSEKVFAAAAATGTATIDCTEVNGTDGTYQRVAVAPGTLVLL